MNTEAGSAELAARAVDGDKAALEEVVRLLKDPLYRLALRMTWRRTFAARFEHCAASPRPTFSPVMYCLRFRRIRIE